VRAALSYAECGFGFLRSRAYRHKSIELIASHRSLHFQPHHLHVDASVFIWGASLNVRIGDLFYKILAQRFWKAPRVWEEDGAYPALERLFPAVHHVLRDQFNTFW
jgi:hypothetical protein